MSDTPTHSVAAVLSTEERRQLLEKMLYARRFEERCYEAYVERKIGGFLHLYSGEEACCYGVMHAARSGHDYVITGYRDHVHAMACGSDPKAVMAELYGKKEGLCKGRGGSMHLFDTANRFMGGYALVGEPFPLAAGLAKAIKMQGGDEIAICFLGDAANNQGTFHETLNLASVWKLPVLFICENNLYGIGTRIDRSTAELDQYKRVSGYCIPSAETDGQDLDAVYAAAKTAVDHVRNQRTPYFLELKTYRYRGHSMSDANAYRVKEEERKWAERDPLALTRDRLILDGVMNIEDYNKMDKQIIQSIEDEVMAYVGQCTEPDVATVEQFVLADEHPHLQGKGAL